MFDTADRIARDLGETVPPSEHLFGPVAEGDEKLWSTATAVNVVLNAQWALYQVLTRLGLHPDAVLGHSSGEILALSAAGVFQTDRALERKLGRLGAIMRGFESSGDLPAARLVAVAAHSDRVEALCRDLGADGVDIAMDNCPHQVVLAVPSAVLPRVVERLRLESILFEELPFSRAYHTPSFRPVVGPIAEFFAQMSFRPSFCPDLFVCIARADARRAPRRSASSPSPSGPKPWRFARRSRPCTPTACACLSTWARAATWPDSSRTSCEASLLSPWPRTFRAAPG